MKGMGLRSNTKVYILLCVFLTAALGLYIGACEPQSDKGDPGMGIGPTAQVTINFRSADGTYSAESNGQDMIEFIATVQNLDGIGYPGVEVRFGASLGYFQPETVATDADGVARTWFRSGCIPGAAMLYASAIGRTASRSVNLWGTPPSLIVQRDNQDIGAGGYLLRSRVTGYFSCSSGSPLAGVDIGFWTELGCLDHGCDTIVTTDVNGIASVGYNPPMWGVYSNLWADYNHPKSCNIIGTYYENGTAYDEYSGSAVIYIYPLQAKLWIGVERDPYTGRYPVYEYGTVPAILYVYWEDNKGGRFPVRGMPVNFELEGDTSAYFASNGGSSFTAYTGSDGYAIVYINGGGDPDDIGELPDLGSATLTATIDETGPGDCCPGTSDGWLWQQQVHLAIGGEMDCKVVLDPEPGFQSNLGIGDTIGDYTDITVMVYDNFGPLDNVYVTASFDIDSMVTNTSCLSVAGTSATYTTSGYTLIRVVRTNTVNCSDAILWVRIACGDSGYLFPYRIEDTNAPKDCEATVDTTASIATGIGSYADVTVLVEEDSDPKAGVLVTASFDPSVSLLTSPNGCGAIIAGTETGSTNSYGKTAIRVSRTADSCAGNATMYLAIECSGTTLYRTVNITFE